MWSFSIFYWVSLCLPLYATYASYKALLTPGTSDDTHWLTYWIVFSALETAEAVIEQLLWIPLYYELKCLLILWLMLPQTKGAQLVFERFIVPFLRKYASQLDPAFKSIDQVFSSKQASGLASQAQDMAKRFGAPAQSGPRTY